MASASEVRRKLDEIQHSSLWDIAETLCDLEEQRGVLQDEIDDLRGAISALEEEQ